MACTLSERIEYFVVLFLITTLSACCSPGIKPGEANLFQAGCGVVSGQYDEDLKAKQKEVDASSNENSSEQQRSIALENMLVTRQDEYQNAKRDLEALENKNSVLENNIEGMQVKTKEDQALKKQYLSKLQQLNGEIDKLKAKVSEEPDKAHLAEIEELKREVETLRTIVLGQ